MLTSLEELIEIRGDFRTLRISLRMSAYLVTGRAVFLTVLFLSDAVLN